jgi:integrase
LLVHAKGGPLTAKYVYRRLQRLRKWIGVKDFAPHAIRRTAISHALNVLNLPITIVRDAAGHSTIGMTNRYARTAAEDVILAMQKM